MGSNVLIIGCGMIGAQLDSPDTPHVLTHAHAFSSHPRFQTIGFLDADGERARAAAQKWKGRAFDSVEAAFASFPVDVAVIAVPDALHYAWLMRLAAFPVRCIVTEKPLATNQDDAEKLRAVFEGKETAVCVNYSRRYLPAFAEAAERIKSGGLGSFLHGRGLYGKGFLHNGSHMVDLIRMLVGDIKAFSEDQRFVDYTENDPTVSGTLSLENGGVVRLDCVDSRLYTLFELDLVFTQGRLRITDGGRSIAYDSVQESPIYRGYRTLHEDRVVSTGMETAFRSLAEHVAQVLSGEVSPACGLEDGYEAVKLCLKINELKK